MMTACDLNGTTKPWEIQREVNHPRMELWDMLGNVRALIYSDVSSFIYE